MAAFVTLSADEDREVRETLHVRRLAESARAWRHGNCGNEELIRVVDEFEAAVPDFEP